MVENDNNLVSIKSIKTETKELNKDTDCLYTGIYDLDILIGDLKKGELIVLGSRPGMGKTSLLLKIARIVSLKKKNVAIFSLENSKEQCMANILSNMAKIDKIQVNNVTLKEEDFDKVEQVKIENIYIDDTPGIAIDKIKEQISNMNKKVDLIMIDYWQLLDYSNNPNKNKDISYKLKKLAQELKVPIIVAFQLSREVDKREDKTPILSDMNCIEDINENADVITFLYRDSYYYEIGCNETELIVAKNKYGENGRVKVEF